MRQGRAVMRGLLRSAGALFAGLIAAGTLDLVLAAASVWLFLGGDFGAEATPIYTGANLGLTFAAGMAGGWVTVRLAGRAPLAHGVGLGLMMVFLTLATGLSGGPGAPAWYGTAAAILGPLGAVAGAVQGSRPGAGNLPAEGPGA